MIKVEKGEKTLKKETHKQLMVAMKQKDKVTNEELRDLLLVVLEELEGCICSKMSR